MKNYTTAFVFCLSFLLYSIVSKGQIDLDSVRIVTQKPPSWKIGSQLEAGIQTLGVRQLNQQLTFRNYRAFNSFDVYFGTHFLLMYRKHLFGLGGSGHRAHNGDNFYLSQFNLGMNYQYTFWKKKSLEFLIHGAAYVSVLQLRAIRPDPQMFPYSFITSFPVSTQFGVGIDKCTGFKGIFGRSTRLDVRVGARLGYSLPWQNQWYESFSNNQPVDGVPLVNDRGFFYLKFVITSLVPLGS